MGIRTGADYVDSLADDREVWAAGKRIEDIREHPAFRPVIESVAAAYDLQHNIAHSDELTMLTETGDRVSRAFEIPRGPEDLAARRRLVETFAALSGGMLGRLPEYGGAFAVGLLNLSDDLGRLKDGSGDRIENWFSACRDSDVFLTTSFVDPQVDRAKPASETGMLHVVDSRDDGIVLRGCKAVATSGAASNEFLVITAPRRFAGDGEVIYITIPPETEGLRFFCREPFGTPDSVFDHPLAARFEESDAWVLFEDVFVPSDRVFFTGNAETGLVAGVFNDILSWPWFHNLTRISVKADLLAGIATLISEYLGTWQFPQVQEAVGETIEYAETIRAFLRTAEVDCVMSPAGIAKPNSVTMSVAKLFAVKNYPRILEIIRELCGQGILMAPQASDLASEIGPRLRSYYEGRDIDPENRIRLFHLAWDVSTHSFGGRQLLFELFNAGGLTVSKLGVANSISKDRYVALAKRIAGIEADLAPATRVLEQSAR